MEYRGLYCRQSGTHVCYAPTASPVLTNAMLLRVGHACEWYPDGSVYKGQFREVRYPPTRCPVLT
eukprot:2767599-Rhodomonas_salina.2